MSKWKQISKEGRKEGRVDRWIHRGKKATKEIWLRWSAYNEYTRTCDERY